MNAMSRSLEIARWTILLLPAVGLAAGVTTEGSIAVGGGGAFLDGDRPAYQQATQHRESGYGGLEHFRLTSESDDSLLKFEARVLPFDGDLKLLARYEKPEKYFIEAGAEQFRIWYDGSAGYFRPTKTSFVLYDEDLSLRRTHLWLELGAYTSNQTLLTLRYDRMARNGNKGSTMWADTNLVGAPYGTRGLVPSFYELDEVTHLFTADASNDAKEGVKWAVGARYQKTQLDNSRNSRRRPTESADRIVTSKDGTKTDIFAAHGFYERKVGEQLTVSGGALVTDLDAVLAGSRIYGQIYDPVFDPAYLRRQQRDEGFYNLGGDAKMKQTVLNLNAVYLPAKNWSIRPSLRFENMHQETISEFLETNIGAGPTFPAIVEEVEGNQKKTWNEFGQSLYARYTGKDWTFNAGGEWIRGHGIQEEERALHTGVLTIDRDSENKRTMQKYSAKANWYASPGVSFTAEYYHKKNANDYDAVRDNTPAGTADRYPAYITDQDFTTDDINLRLSWRPVTSLNTVTRYDYQRSKIVSNEAGLTPAESSRMTSHILSESITWTPMNRLFVNASVNMTWDQLATPAYKFVLNSDNNYVNGSIGGGYAVAKLDDVYFDYSFFRANNFVDNSALSLPYGADRKLQGTYVTWVRRQTEHLIYTFKYGYVTNRDVTWAGRNDFDAQVIYAKVQYRF
jgi:hypothetical protein